MYAHPTCVAYVENFLHNLYDHPLDGRKRNWVNDDDSKYETKEKINYHEKKKKRKLLLFIYLSILCSLIPTAYTMRK